VTTRVVPQVTGEPRPPSAEPSTYSDAPQARPLARTPARARDAEWCARLERGIARRRLFAALRQLANRAALELQREALPPVVRPLVGRVAALAKVLEGLAFAAQLFDHKRPQFAGRAARRVASRHATATASLAALRKRLAAVEAAGPMPGWVPSAVEACRLFADGLETAAAALLADARSALAVAVFPAPRFGASPVLTAIVGAVLPLTLADDGEEP
jgi:hypothetical protein